MPETIHATCVAILGKGVLLLGHSGCGKSDLALRLIDSGATLVGDDQIIVTEHSGMLYASPAPNIHGMIEARSVGILHMPFVSNIPLALAVNLSPHNEPERLPHPSLWSCQGVQIPLLYLSAFDASTPSKIRLYLQYAKEPS